MAERSPIRQMTNYLRAPPWIARHLNEFVQSRSERQILAPKPKYEGNIVATYENERWAADLISYVSRPAKLEDKTYTHILLVQDIFSRFLYARPLVSVSETTKAFEEILSESEGRENYFLVPLGIAFLVPKVLDE